MRTPLIVLAILLTSAAASAQVVVDPRALEPLQPPGTTAPKQAPAKPAAPVAKPAPARQQPPAAQPTTPPTASGTMNSLPSGTTVRPVPGTAGRPVVPANAPPTPQIPPAITVPARPAPPATPPMVTADSPTTSNPLTGGLRVVFGTGRADLNPAAETAIRSLARATGPVSPEASSFTVTSFAAGTAEDPSSARRLSLSRALTVRSVLISAGVASVRIYVKAFGPASPGFADGPADRTDIMIALNAVPAPAPAPKPPAPQAASPAVKPR